MRSRPELSEHELRTRLRSVAVEHQPDRAAMLHRIARHRPGSPVADRRPAGQALRLAGSALAVATIVGVGGVAQWALADGPEPDAPPAGPRTTASPAVPTAATSRPGAKASAGPSSPAAGRNAGPPPARESPEGRQLLWADGSVNTAGRSDITVKVRRPVRALEVTVRVALTPGLTDLGAAHDVASARIGTTVIHERDALFYRFRLAGGGTLGAGTYVFTAKYAHDDEGGRDAGADTYRVIATTAGEPTELTFSGDFY